MRFRFIGEYTGGRTAINACGVVFTGREPAEVASADAIRRLTGNQEFEEVTEIVAPVEKPAKKRAASLKQSIRGFEQ